VLAAVAAPARVSVGEASRAQLTLGGARPGWRGNVAVSLYGPFRRTAAIRCDRTPSWQGYVAANGSGVLTTSAATLDRPGWYVYRVAVPGEARAIGAATSCDDRGPRVLVEARPTVAAAVSSVRVRSGGQVSDRIFVAGLAGEQAPLRAALYGPFPTRAAIRCDERPIWSASLTALDDGRLDTQPFTLTKAGLYAFSVRLVARPFVRRSETVCGEVGQTTTAFARARPVAIPVLSQEVVRAGSDVSGVVRLQNLGGARAEVAIQVFGPFASRAATRCTGQPYWQERVSARGVRAVASPAVHLARAGFYAFRARVVGNPAARRTATSCSRARTLLAAPRIVTGGRTAQASARAGAARSRAPTRVRAPSVDLDVPLKPAAIDTIHGKLGVPTGIRRGGWWRDGAAPGARVGAVLLAAHVDSARRGEGAFFNLRLIRPGARVELTGAGDKTFEYRVVSIRSYAKAGLPTSIYSRRGPPRLVLVTCGGPFNPVTGRYRDNVVVTAIPADAS
jgi:hypothetical protein